MNLTTLALASVLVGTTPVVASAQTAKQIASQEARIAKAEAGIAMSTCKLEALKAGHTARQAVYYTFMAECLAKAGQ